MRSELPRQGSRHRALALLSRGNDWLPAGHLQALEIHSDFNLSTRVSHTQSATKAFQKPESHIHQNNYYDARMNAEERNIETYLFASSRCELSLYERK